MGRGKNWKNEEVVALVNSIEPRYSQLFGKFDNKVTHEHKENLWTIITDEVNAVGQENRNVEQVKEKFKKLRKDVKSKVAAIIRKRNKTGGGQSREITMNEVETLMADTCLIWEKKIVQLHGIQAIAGIKGGIDSSSKSNQSETVNNLISNLPSTSSGNPTNVNLDDDSDEDSQHFFNTANSNISHVDPSVDIENEPLTRGSSQIPGNSQSLVNKQLNPDFSSQEILQNSQSDHQENSARQTTTISNILRQSEIASCSSTKTSKQKKDENQPEGNKKRKKSEVAIDVGETMIDIQKQILKSTQSIADSFEEFVKVQKLQMGLNPDEPIPPHIPSTSNEYEIVINESEN